MGKPVILTLAFDRISGGEKIFTYDYERDLNVVASENGKKNFIEMSYSSLELETKTRILRESDDEQFLNELETKTKMDRESDDDSFSLHELVTKSFVERERDDEDTNYN